MLFKLWSGGRFLLTLRSETAEEQNLLTWEGPLSERPEPPATRPRNVTGHSLRVRVGCCNVLWTRDRAATKRTMKAPAVTHGRAGAGPGSAESGASPCQQSSCPLTRRVQGEELRLETAKPGAESHECSWAGRACRPKRLGQA